MIIEWYTFPHRGRAPSDYHIGGAIYIWVYTRRMCVLGTFGRSLSAAMRGVEMAREAITLILLSSWHVGFCLGIPASVGKTSKDLLTRRPFDLALLQKLQNIGQTMRSNRLLPDGVVDRELVDLSVGDTAAGGGQEATVMKREFRSNDGLILDALRKRGFQPWGGKRAGRETVIGRAPFIIQRKGFQPWGGKRNEAQHDHQERLDVENDCLFNVDESDVSKRGFQPWGGKRVSAGQHAVRCRYLQLSNGQDFSRNRRGFQPWGGKRTTGGIKTEMQDPNSKQQWKEDAIKTIMLDGVAKKDVKDNTATGQNGASTGHDNEGRDDQVGAELTSQVR